MMKIPVIDLSVFGGKNEGGDDATSKANAEKRKEVAKLLRSACHEIGFFYISGHGCDEQSMKSGINECSNFFAMNHDDKMKLNACNSSLYRGYNSSDSGSHSCTPEDGKNNKDAADGEDDGTKKGLPDFKESFTIGAEGSASPMHGMNQWPRTEDLPHFEETMRKYWSVLLNTVSVRLMKALAMSLELDDEDFFVKQCDDPVAQMVLLQYPPSDAAAKRRGCGAHTDCGFLTILNQDEPGLEVLANDGTTWIAASPIPGTFVVNLGDMAARWSNDYYKSTIHRVNNPSSTIVRNSIPFFVNCNYDAHVECILSKDSSSSKKYEPVTAGEYILEKLGLMWLADQAASKKRRID